MKTRFFVIPILFFSILFSTGVFAYADIDLNASYTGTITSTRGMACTNLTGTFYCYLAGGDAGNNIIIERYDLNWANMETCDTGLSGPTAVVGLGIANETHLIWKQTDSTFRLIPIWQIHNQSNCGTVNFGSHSTGSSRSDGGYYNVEGDGVSGWVYWGVNDFVRNSTFTTTVFPAFWNTNYHTLRFPDQYDNTTLYAEYNEDMIPYTSGVAGSSLGTIADAYGSTGVSSNWDLYKENASITWIYWYSTFLYRANFTKMLDLQGGISIIRSGDSLPNITTTETIHTLGVILTSNCTGTIRWYIDSNNFANTSVTTANGTEVIYYQSTGQLNQGDHTWMADFLDDCNGNTWNMTSTLGVPIRFRIIAGGGSIGYLYERPMDWLALRTGALFGIEDIESARIISAFLFSFILTITSLVLMSHYSKGHIDVQPTTYSFIFLTWLIMFSLIGWVEAWVMAVIILVAGFVFIQNMRMGGG